MKFQLKTAKKHSRLWNGNSDQPRQITITLTKYWASSQKNIMHNFLCTVTVSNSCKSVSKMAIETSLSWQRWSKPNNKVLQKYNRPWLKSNQSCRILTIFPSSSTKQK